MSQFSSSLCHEAYASCVVACLMTAQLLMTFSVPSMNRACICVGSNYMCGGSNSAATKCPCTVCMMQQNNLATHGKRNRISLSSLAMHPVYQLLGGNVSHEPHCLLCTAFCGFWPYNEAQRKSTHSSGELVCCDHSSDQGPAPQVCAHSLVCMPRRY